MMSTWLIGAHHTDLTCSLSYTAEHAAHVINNRAECWQTQAMLHLGHAKRLVEVGHAQHAVGIAHRLALRCTTRRKQVFAARKGWLAS